MYQCSPRHVTEIESISALQAHIEAAGHLRDVAVQGLDLTDDDTIALLRSVPAEDACFLGCRLSDEAERHIRETGGTVFPAFIGIPFNPYRGSLYTPGELMDGYDRSAPRPRSGTVDTQIYDYFHERQLDGREAPVMDALAFRIHDHAIDDALRDLLSAGGPASRRVVAIMGGHQMGRDTEIYRSVAEIGWTLARRNFFVATGGGPGAMEAANLGAALAGYGQSALDDAVDHLSGAPQYQDSGYLARAMDVRERYQDRTESLAVPTWFYGHEPSNLFPTHVAKYFANSLREDGLLAIAKYGVIYAPGSAGTIQEVFMDAAQNHYETFGPASPMVFFDQSYWTETKPVHPVLETLARDTAYEEHVHACDTVEAVASVIERHGDERTIPTRQGDEAPGS